MNHESIRRRNLPHWDVPGAAYFVTTCLDGSIPAQGRLDLDQFRTQQLAVKPADVSEQDWRARNWKRVFARADRWLDEEPANRALENPALATVVVDALLYFAGERYDLFAFVVMPSHLHWLFQPLASWVETLEDDSRSPRERITYSLNRFTATRCNRLLGARGSFWQTESYDHWARDVEELERILLYIENNPVRAGLVKAPEEWLFSSAAVRKQQGLAFGEPLRKF